MIDGGGIFGGMPWWYLLTTVLLLAVGLWLNAQVLRKAGFSVWWALLFVVPLLWIVGVWIFAFVRWPRIDRVRATPPSDYEGGWDVPPRRGERGERR